MDLQKYLSTIFMLVVFLISSITNATLVGRDLDGDLNTAEAYYDSDADLTWLADVNPAESHWDVANTWATSLNIGGVTGWRLPYTLQPDPTCSDKVYLDNSNTLYDIGYNCTGSELGNMFYNVLGGKTGRSIHVYHNTYYDLFSIIPLWGGWWSDDTTPNPDTAWVFSFQYGDQAAAYKPYSYTYAWAVHSGDVGNAATVVIPEPVQSPVPIPTAVWLFGSGLIGLISIAKQKKFKH